MHFYKTARFSISFGNIYASFGQEEFLTIPDEPTFRMQRPFQEAVSTLQLDHLMVLNQVHGADGKLFATHDDFLCRPYAFDGDYLITSVPRAGIGVATADCLPIVLYDSQNHSVALVHAGWRGSVAGICQKAILHMQKAFGTKTQNLQVVFGPSARVCCYEVGNEFKGRLALEDRDEVCRDRAGKLFFDGVQFNRLQLCRMGVPQEAIQMDYNVCTICSADFCSYRREGSLAKRQMTIVTLHE